MAKLTIIDADGTPPTVGLDKERRYVVGRSEDSDIVLHDPALSRSHAELSLEPGDLIFVCNDGVTDVVDSELEPFGEKRLAETLRSFAGNTPEEVWHALDDLLSAHAGG
jgi:hypothetical protein